MIDVVFPSNNEEQFIDMAIKLQHRGILFVYNKVTDKTINKVKDLRKKTKLKLFVGVQRTAKNLDHKNFNEDIKILIAQGPDEARRAIEKTEVSLVYDLETGMRGDKMHYPQSGLNHIVAKIAHDQQKIIGLSFSTLVSAKGMKRTRILGRMKQNIKLCRKYKVAMCLGSFAHDPYHMRQGNDLMSLGITLGMTPGQAKQAVFGLGKRL